LNVNSVFDNTGHGWIAAGILQHLGAKFLMRLRVAIDKGKALRIVILARLLAVGTTWFGIDDQRQLVHLRWDELSLANVTQAVSCGASCELADTAAASQQLALQKRGRACLNARPQQHNQLVIPESARPKKTGHADLMSEFRTR